LQSCVGDTSYANIHMLGALVIDRRLRSEKRVEAIPESGTYPQASLESFFPFGKKEWLATWYLKIV